MKRPLLWLALITHAVLATAYLLHTPAFEGPDENDHCYYASYLQHTGQLPRISETPAMTGGMLAHHPPLYYATLGLLTDVVGSGDYTPCWTPNPAWPSDAAGGQIKWLHGHDELPPISDEVGVLRWMRGLSVLFGLATLLLTHRLGLALFPDRPLIADTATVLLACIPQWSWLHGCVDNGNLATTLSSGALLIMVLGLRGGRLGVGGGLAAGGLAGLALITKLTAIFTLPLLATTYGLLLWRRPDHRREVLMSGLAAVVAVLAVAGWSFLRNWQLYDDPLAMSAHGLAFAQSRVPNGQLGEYLTGMFLTKSFGTMFAGFGWSTVRLPWLVEIGALVVIGTAAIGWWRDRRGLGAAGMALWIPALTIVLVVASLARYNMTYVQPQGRYLLPAYGAGTVLVCAGISGLVKRTMPRGWPWGLAAALVVGAVLTFTLVFLPVFPRAANAPSPFYASMIEGLTTAAPPERTTIRALEPADGARTLTTPTFRWDDPDDSEGQRYSIHIVVASGVPIATYESGLIEITGHEWTMPAAFWQSLEGLGPFSWKVRRLPDRARGEGVADVPESAPRQLSRE